MFLEALLVEFLCKETWHAALPTAGHQQRLTSTYQQGTVIFLIYLLLFESLWVRSVLGHIEEIRVVWLLCMSVSSSIN
jgi:hypothetical protein